MGKAVKRWVPMVAAALLLAVGAQGCTSSAGVASIGLYYTGGPIQGRHFKRVILPGSGVQFKGFGDTVAWLPAGLRSYIVSKNKDEGDRKRSDFIRVPAQGTLMDFEVSVYFKLNTHVDDIPGFKGGTLRRFYEQICKKYNCADSAGWNKMLDETLRKIIETSIQEKVRPLDVNVLYAGQSSGGAEGLTTIQNAIGATLKDRVNSVLGGEYFCGPKFDQAKLDCPPLDFVINSAEPVDQSVRDSYAKIRSSANDVQSAANEAQAAAKEGEGEAAKQNALKQAGELTSQQIAYIEAQAALECARRQGCTMIVGSSGVNVNVGGK